MGRSTPDQNFKGTITGVDSNFFVTPTEPAVDPVTHELLVKPTLPGFSISNYDYIGVAYPDTTTEVYTYKSGGSGGTTVATITVVYSDSSKANLTSVTKT